MRAFALRLGSFLLMLGLLFPAAGGVVLALPQREAVTPDEFWQRVDQSLATLRGLNSQPDAFVTQTLDRLADAWAGLNAIKTADGGSAPLDTGFIVSELRRRPYDLGGLTDLFNALHNAHSENPTRAFGPAELAAVQVILQRPEFQWDRPPSPLQEWLDALWQRMIDWLQRTFGNLSISLPVPVDILTIVASLVLVIVLLYIFRGLFADLIVESRLEEQRDAGDENLTAESALQKAKDISRGGDYRTAVRYLYLSSLLLLDERGLLRFDRSKTNREYLRSVSAFPQLSGPLRDVIDVFDRVWYGFHTIDQDDFEHYVEKVDQLREQNK
jgi:hypothetical protein